MVEQDINISMKAPSNNGLHQDLLEDIHWSASRTMTMSSIYGSAFRTVCFISFKSHPVSVVITIHINDEQTRCQTFFSFLWTWSKPLICIWIITVESFLAIYVYWDHKTFFNISISFISVPLAVSSLYICHISWQSCNSHFDRYDDYSFSVIMTPVIRK